MEKKKFKLKTSVDYRQNQKIWDAIESTFVERCGYKIKRDRILKNSIDCTSIALFFFDLENKCRIDLWRVDEPLSSVMEKLPTLNAVYDAIEAKVSYKFA